MAPQAALASSIRRCGLITGSLPFRHVPPPPPPPCRLACNPKHLSVPIPGCSVAHVFETIQQPTDNGVVLCFLCRETPLCVFPIFTAPRSEGPLHWGSTVIEGPGLSSSRAQQQTREPRHAGPSGRRLHGPRGPRSRAAAEIDLSDLQGRGVCALRRDKLPRGLRGRAEPLHRFARLHHKALGRLPGRNTEVLSAAQLPFSFAPVVSSPPLPLSVLFPPPPPPSASDSVE